jgi:hypothetical protein
MTNKEILSKVNTLLKRAFVKLEQQTLENGTVIEAESFAVGSPVFIITEDQKLPLPVGEYKLADGSTLEVIEEGIIAGVEVAETAEVAMADEVVETAPVAEEVAADVKAIVDAVVEVIAPVLEEVQMQITEMKKEMASYVKKEQMSAKKPIKHNPEAKEKTKNTFLYAQEKPKGTINSVFNKLNF